MGNYEKIQKLRGYVLALEGVANCRPGNEDKYHPEGDALTHSHQAAALALQFYKKDQDFVQACLLHDIGKSVDLDRHAKVGASMIRDLDLPTNIVCGKVIYLVENHMRPKDFDDMSIGKMESLVSAPFFNDLMRLRKIDVTARKKGWIPKLTIHELMDQILVSAMEYQEIHELWKP